MTSPVDNFQDAIEEKIWNHSNLSTEERADVLREHADALEADESRFDSVEEHVRKTLDSLGYAPPEDGHE